jgi:hypothetical protein
MTRRSVFAVLLAPLFQLVRRPLDYLGWASRGEVIACGSAEAENRCSHCPRLCDRGYYDGGYFHQFRSAAIRSGEACGAPSPNRQRWEASAHAASYSERTPSCWERCSKPKGHEGPHRMGVEHKDRRYEWKGASWLS